MGVKMTSKRTENFLNGLIEEMPNVVNKITEVVTVKAADIVYDSYDDKWAKSGKGQFEKYRTFKAKGGGTDIPGTFTGTTKHSIAADVDGPRGRVLLGYVVGEYAKGVKATYPHWQGATASEASIFSNYFTKRGIFGQGTLDINKMEYTFDFMFLTDAEVSKATSRVDGFISRYVSGTKIRGKKPAAQEDIRITKAHARDIALDKLQKSADQPRGAGSETFWGLDPEKMVDIEDYLSRQVSDHISAIEYSKFLNSLFSR